AKMTKTSAATSSTSCSRPRGTARSSTDGVGSGRRTVMGHSKEVDAWFERYENPMKPVLLRIRSIVLGADRRIEECIKWQAPTFTYRRNLASFFPKSKQHASLMFH